MRKRIFFAPSYGSCRRIFEYGNTFNVIGIDVVNVALVGEIIQYNNWIGRYFFVYGTAAPDGNTGLLIRQPGACIYGVRIKNQSARGYWCLYSG